MRSCRDGNLAPVIVGLAPISRGPMVVEGIKGFVLRFQPVLELTLRRVIVRHQGVAVLVIDLPADNIGIVSKSPGHLFGNPAAELDIFYRGRRTMSSISMAYALSIWFHA